MKQCRDYPDAPNCCPTCHADADEYWPNYPLHQILDSTGNIVAEVCCVVADCRTKARARFAEPGASPGETMNCEEILEIGDDFGDNVATMHCQLDKGHEGNPASDYEKSSSLGMRWWNGDSPERERREKGESK